MSELESTLVQELRKEIEALKNQNIGLINAIKQLRKHKQAHEKTLAENKKTIRELTERIAELEDIDSLPSENDNLSHEGE